VSRAFVDENDSQYDEGETPEVKVPLPAGARNYMTPEGADRMRRALDDLARGERPRLLAEVSRASEGAADKDALAALRKRLRGVERRIEYLTRLLAITEVVDPARQPAGRVAFGAHVTVAEEGTGERTYRIVGVDESDPEAGTISWISPLARALNLRSVGDIVTLKLPAGEKKMVVLAIAYR
jgi:transcription elongation factor GreB